MMFGYFDCLARCPVSAAVRPESGVVRRLQSRRLFPSGSTVTRRVACVLAVADNLLRCRTE